MPAARRIYKLKTLSTGLTKARRLQLKTNVECAIQYSNETNPTRLRLSTSCPDIGSRSISIREYSSLASPLTLRKGSLHQLTYLSNYHDALRRGYATCEAKCPCPFPCGPCGCKAGCGCLPPPCNTPAKCLQYMTGYYYYPYGTWFCGPYHVAGTCSPVGANGPPCPCPCPAKCCPACLCPVPGELDKNFANFSQFPVEVPCQTTSKSPNESRSSLAKFFTFNAPDKKVSDPKQKRPMPPVLASMVCPNSQEPSDLLKKELRIQSSFSVPNPKQKARSYHTKTKPISDASSKTPIQYKQKNWRYSYYQKRHKIVTPLERTRVFLKENRNRPSSKLESVNTNSNQKRRDPRPDVDIELKPYET